MIVYVFLCINHDSELLIVKRNMTSEELLFCQISNLIGRKRASGLSQSLSGGGTADGSAVRLPPVLYSIISIIIIIYLFYIALNPCTVLSASQLKGVTLHH